MSEPVFKSPLAQRVAKGPSKDLSISITEVATLGMIDVRGLASDEKFLATIKPVLGIDLPREPRTSTTQGDITALWLSVDQWVVLCPREDAGALATALTTTLEGIHSLVCNMSDARAIIRLEGNGTREVLMKGMAVDLFDPGCGAGTVRRALFAGIAALFHIRAVEPDVIDLYVFRSYANYAWDWLARTARISATVRLFGEQHHL